jgi:hypothetical protein
MSEVSQPKIMLTILSALNAIMLPGGISLGYAEASLNRASCSFTMASVSSLQ